MTWYFCRHIFQTVVSMDHFTSDAFVFLVEFYVDPKPTRPVLEFFKYPIPDQYLIFHTAPTLLYVMINQRHKLQLSNPPYYLYAPNKK